MDTYLLAASFNDLSSFFPKSLLDDLLVFSLFPLLETGVEGADPLTVGGLWGWWGVTGFFIVLKKVFY